MRFLKTCIVMACSFAVSVAYAGGVGLGATRIIYSSSLKQSVLDVRNTNKDSPFLIQSWIEDSEGNRNNDFVITPPLYVLKPATESMIKIIFNAKPLVQDRESLYWVTVKAIPQQSQKEVVNSLQFASANRIKLFYRPVGLTESVIEAPKKISARISDGKITLVNPTPYFLTTINLKVDSKSVQSVMIPPKSSVILSGVFINANQVSYQTINDYGAWTPVIITRPGKG